MNNDLFLKKISNIINYKDYDYINEPETKPKFSIEGRRWYENPFFWKDLFDNKINNSVRFFINYINIVDQQILEALIYSDLKNKVLISILNIIIKENINKLNFDKLMFCAIDSNKYKILEMLINTVKKQKIKAPYGNWGNVANGRGLSESSKLGNIKIVKFLLDNGADVTKDDGFAYLNAIKHCNFHIARLLIDKGIDIHMKNDFALILLKKKENNYKNDKEKNDKNFILNLYK